MIVNCSDYSDFKAVTSALRHNDKVLYLQGYSGPSNSYTLIYSLDLVANSAVLAAIPYVDGNPAVSSSTITTDFPAAVQLNHYMSFVIPNISTEFVPIL